MNWEEVYVVAGFSAFSAVLVHVIYKWLIKQAQQNMGIAAGPRVDALTKQRKQMVILATIIGPVLMAGFAASGHLGGKRVSWRDYASEEGAYAAQFPGEFHESNQTIGPDGSSFNLHVVEASLGSNGNFGIIDREGPKLTYQTNDQKELLEVDNGILTEMKASADGTKFPFPAAWGEVACTELHAHMNDNSGDVIVRSWRTGAHQYSAVALYPKLEKADAVVQQFMDSIHPTGEYKKPGGNHSGIE